MRSKCCNAVIIHDCYPDIDCMDICDKCGKSCDTGKKLAGTFVEPAVTSTHGHIKNGVAVGCSSKKCDAPIGMPFIEEISKQMGIDYRKHIEEYSSAFAKKWPDVDPRKFAMILHTDYVTGKTYVWMERKRGRSRKEVIKSLKST